jgi:hypothetical protein
MPQNVNQRSRPQGVESSALLGRIAFFLFTLCILPWGWAFYDAIENHAPGRVVVGAFNCLNGIAVTLLIQSWRRPNAPR